MSLFTVLEGATAVLKSKGVYRQVPVYTRRGLLFARWGAGFISLRADGATSLPDVRVDYLECFERLESSYLFGVAVYGTFEKKHKPTPYTGPWYQLTHKDDGE